jgi:hypothetical protein
MARAKANILAKLREQMGFLRTSLGSFYEGNFAENARIATTIRVLVHETGNSKPLPDHRRLITDAPLSFAVSGVRLETPDLAKFLAARFPSLHLTKGSTPRRIGIQKESGRGVYFPSLTLARLTV